MHDPRAACFFSCNPLAIFPRVRYLYNYIYTITPH
jgi:hypothetical protein